MAHSVILWSIIVKVLSENALKSNLSSIAGTIQAYHDAVFVGAGKKCDRKRNRNTVKNQIAKVELIKYC